MCYKSKKYINSDQHVDYQHEHDDPVQFVVDGFSLVRVIMYIFNLHTAEESMDNIWEKFELEWLLYILVIYVLQNSKTLAKTGTLNAGTSEET